MFKIIYQCIEIRLQIKSHRFFTKNSGRLYLKSAEKHQKLN